MALKIKIKIKRHQKKNFKKKKGNKEFTVLGKALEESPPWAHTSGGFLSQLHFRNCSCTREYIKR